jgi:hypothetical protein
MCIYLFTQRQGYVLYVQGVSAKTFEPNNSGIFLRKCVNITFFNLR